MLRLEIGPGLPTLPTVEKLARALGLAPGWLAFGLGDIAAAPAGDELLCRGLAERERAVRAERGLSALGLAKAYVRPGGLIWIPYAIYSDDEMIGLRAPGETTSRLLMIVEADDAPLGLIVDELLAQQQIVVKSLETNFGRIEGLAGATILGDGRVAFIVDIVALTRGIRRGGRQLAA